MTRHRPTADLLALLDQLDAARAAIGDSPAFRVVGFVQDDEAPEQVLARFDDGGASVFAECYGTDAAALIVAAVNAQPKLTAALRAVLELCANADHDAARIAAEHGVPPFDGAPLTRHLRYAITAALTPEQVQP